MSLHKLRTLAAAIMPNGIVSWLKKRRIAKYQEDAYGRFVARNTLANLQKVRLPSSSGPPPAMPEALTHYESAQAVAHALAFADRSGMLRYLDSADGRTANEVAEQFGYGQRQTSALLRLLVAANLLELNDLRYGLNGPTRLYLFADSPLYVGDQLPASYISKSLMTGNARPKAIQAWQGGQSSEERSWAVSMHTISFKLGFALGSTGLLRGAARLLDIAGGAGSMCIAVALGNPELQATLLELPGSARVAQDMVNRYEIADRVRCIGGDMFRDEWQADNDIVLFTNIFNGWSPEQCLRLAKKAFASLRPGGSVLLVEALLDEERPGPVWVEQFSLHMAFSMDGQQFRGSELIALLAEAGFTNLRWQPLLGYYSVIVGQRPG